MLVVRRIGEMAIMRRAIITKEQTLLSAVVAVGKLGNAILLRRNILAKI